MKIVFLNHFISGGGAERFTCLLADKMVEKGHSVILMTNLFKPFAYSVSEQVKKRGLYNTEKEAKSRVPIYHMIRNTRYMMKEEQPDVVIGVMPLMNFVAVMAAVGLKTKVIVSDHTSFDRKLPFYIRLIRKYAYRLADHVTVLTQADCNYLGNKLPRKTVMPNPLAYPCVKQVEVNRRKNVLAVGRIDDWRVKGFDILLQAWSLIAEKHKDWVLEIAGGGKETSKETLLQIAKDYNVEDSVKLLGFRRDIDSVMRESSIFVLSSRVEGFGMVLIEAMSQGCVCISFDDGGRQREIISSEKEGIVVEGHDVRKLAESLDIVIDDPGMRHALSEAAVKRADYFNLDIIELRWEKLIKSL